MRFFRASLMVVFVTVLCGCRTSVAQPTVSRRGDASTVAAHAAVIRDQPPPRADGVSSRESAIAAAVAARGVQTPVVVNAPIDVDGDGVADTLFHTLNPVLYGIAREHADIWRVDLLDGQTGSQELASWGPVVPLTRGAALMLVRSLRTAPTEPITNQIVGILVTEPGAAPTAVYTEVYPASATWTMRAAGADALELQRIREPLTGQATPPQPEHKMIHRSATANWRPASCWGSEVHDVLPSTRRCEVASPEGTAERSWEQYRNGPPLETGTRVELLYRGAPPDPTPFTQNSCVQGRNGRINCTRTSHSFAGYQNWCVSLPAGTTNWVYLPSAAVAGCTPEGLRR